MPVVSSLGARPWLSCTVAVAAAVVIQRAWRLLSPPSRSSASDKRLGRWVDMWSAGRTQFHQPTVNHVLLKYQSELLDGQDHRVFVPLCGKSVDLVWLSQNEKVKEVIGNEAVSRAVAEFAEENTNLGLEVVPAEQPFKRFVSPLGLTVLQGDHFFLSPAVTGTVDRIWDRASLVAINPADRVKYVEVLDALLRPEGKILLVSLHRAGGDAEAVSKGPPFSVTEDDVRALFDAERYGIRKLLSQELINDPAYKRFVEAGLTSYWRKLT